MLAGLYLFPIHRLLNGILHLVCLPFKLTTIILSLTFSSLRCSTKQNICIRSWGGKQQHLDAGYFYIWKERLAQRCTSTSLSFSFSMPLGKNSSPLIKRPLHTFSHMSWSFTVYSNSPMLYVLQCWQWRTGYSTQMQFGWRRRREEEGESQARCHLQFKAFYKKPGTTNSLLPRDVSTHALFY